MRSKIVLAIGIALMASACTKKAEGQTVAIVNGEEITAAELNAELANAKMPEGADKDQARSRVLQAMIDRRLLAQQAKTDGIDKSPEFLNRQRRANEDLLINMFASRQIDTAQAARELGNREVPGEPSLDLLDSGSSGTSTSSASRCRRTRRRERSSMQAKTLEEVAKVLTDADIAFTRQKNRLDTAVIPQNLYGQLAAAGRASEPFIIPVGNQAVASTIVSREPAPITGEQARPIAVAAMRREQASQLMQNRLKSIRDAAKIEYKEGYAPPAAKK